MKSIRERNLAKLQKANYYFVYNDKLCDSKERFKQMLFDGLILADLNLFYSDTSGILFDKDTCDYNLCSTLYWLHFEDKPEDIVWSVYDDRYFHIDDVVECFIDRHNHTYVSIQNSTWLYNGVYYLEECLEEFELVLYDGEVYDMDDMVYCEDTGETIPSEHAYYDDESEEYYAQRESLNKKGLKGYHQSKIEDKSNNSKIKIGFEIEKEDSNFSDYTNVRNIGWDAERDGSLNNNGFELVSAIYNLEDLTQLKEDTEQIAEFLKADYSRNCGGHINVSIQDKTKKEVFEMIRGYVPLIYAMYYGRLDNRFSMAKKIEELDQYNRYDAFNFTKDKGILEFRIFSAVRTREQLIWRAEFIALLFKHHRKGSASVLKMLFTDSPIRKHLLKIYEKNKFEALIDRCIKYTDIYMTAKDSQQTARIIINYKNKAEIITEAQTIIKEAVETGRDMVILNSDDNA